MKKNVFYLIACVVACCAVGCTPVNSPDADEFVNLIDLGYSSMGKPCGEQLLKEITSMGYELEILPEQGREKDITVYRETKRHKKDYDFQLQFSVRNDTVILFIHSYPFNSKYAEAAEKFLMVTDHFFNNDNWIQWIGSTDCVTQYGTPLDRPTFISQLKENIIDYKMARLGMQESGIIMIEDKLLEWMIQCTGGSILGENINTGEGLSSMASMKMNATFQFSPNTDYRLY